MDARESGEQAWLGSSVDERDAEDGEGQVEEVDVLCGGEEQALEQGGVSA